MPLLPSSVEERSFLGIPNTIHRYIYVGALALLVIGLPLSPFLTSLPQFILAGNWLLEGGLKNKMRKFFQNKAALVLCSFFLMHLLGLLYTSHAGMDYGLEDVRKKIPLFLLPFLFSTSSVLTDKEKRMVLLCFVIAVTVATFYGLGLLLAHKFVDIRQISDLMDPVRQAMMQVLCGYLLIYDVFTNKRGSLISALLLLWAAWLFTYLFIMQSLTGVIIVMVITALLLIIWAFKKLKVKSILSGILVLATAAFIIIGSIGYVTWFRYHYFPKPDKLEFSKLDKATVGGRAYHNDTICYLTENGHYAYIYVCEDELRRAWNARSKRDYDGADAKGNKLSQTLIRYMTSKGLRKDSVGMQQMTADDIKAVEESIPNYQYTSLTSIQYRLYQVFWEIRDSHHGGSANGHSLTQRFEFWRAATGIIKKHWLAGVGTGDVRIAFNKQYDEMNSTLDRDSRLRSHNQYLEIGVAFGIIGIIWFIFNLWYPAFQTGKIHTYGYFIFWVIMMIAILTEDTLETQAGATFYALFNAFFLFL